MKIAAGLVAMLWVGCGADPDRTSGQGAAEQAGGEQAALLDGAEDGGAAIEEPAVTTDPGAAGLDEPPPPMQETPATLAGREGVPPEGIVREEPRTEGGVRLVVALPASADGNAVFEVQTTPARSGGFAVFAVRTVHPTAEWASCSTLSLDIDGRTVALQDVRVLAGASVGGVVEAARAPAEIRVARRLASARVFAVSACGDSFAPPAAARPVLARFVARLDELSRAPAPSSAAAPTPGR